MTANTLPDSDRMSKDEVLLKDTPGETLRALREAAGQSLEYVASKLHLRVRVIELLEADAYDEMPEQVFIKGYLRAYSNLLEVSPEPILRLFSACCPEQAAPAERMLWQSSKVTNKTEHWIRIGTGIFAGVVVFAVVLWWHKNKEVETFFSKHVHTAEFTDTSDIRLTDLSSMRSLLSSNQQELPPLELKHDG